MATAMGSSSMQRSHLDPVGANLSPLEYSQLGRQTYTADVDTEMIQKRTFRGAHGAYYKGTRLEDANFNLCKGDLVLHRAGKAERFKQGKQGMQHRPQVFSSMNALLVDPSVPKWKLIEQYRLGGMAQIQVSFKNKIPTTKQISVTDGGTGSIKNNSTVTIHAGDELYWDPPDQGENGEAVGFTPDPAYPNKVPAAIVKPYKKSSHNVDLRKKLVKFYADGDLNSPASAQADPAAIFFDMLVAFAAAVGNDSEADRLDAYSGNGSGALRTRVLDILTEANSKGVSFEYNSVFSPKGLGMLENLMEACAQQMDYINCRKFAIARSTAGPGSNLDICWRK